MARQGANPLGLIGSDILGNSQHMFLWGAATSAFQVEGDLPNSNWSRPFWRIEKQLGRGCDHHNRVTDDLDLMVGMGLNSFRFSLEWSRIEPASGKFDEAALAHYQGVVDACRARGIEPVVTLWHFSYPRWLDAQGGWAHPDIVPIFSRYARWVGERLKGVKWWLTQNEPNAFAVNTALLRVFPPGKGSFGAMSRHIFAAHKAAYRELKGSDPTRKISANAFHWHPRNGKWPNTLDYFAKLEAFDYIAIDYYFAFHPWEWPRLAFQWDWPVHAPSFTDTLMAYWKRFHLPILVAENGLCLLRGKPRKDGWTREAYLAHHVFHMQRAMDQGAEVAGYMHWSLLDNYEMGTFEPRFGLYQVDFAQPELPRIATPAVEVYREIATAGQVTPDLVRRFGIV